MAFAYAAGDVVCSGRFRIVRVLACGGMGSVYEVEDVGLGRMYVLKTLHGELAGEGELRRQMQREARVLGRVAHRNVVEVFTAGVTDDAFALPYIVMERLTGATLREVLRGHGRLPVRAATCVAIDLLDALDHVHELGVVHCDLKPENIFLHERRGEVTPKLLDFGVVRLLPRGEARMKRGGTLRYASPEQVRGEEVGPWSDVYSMGLVVYEMLAGKSPWEDARGPENVAKAQLMRAPLPIAGVPATLMGLVLRALAKDPAARPRDAFAFARDLRELAASLAGEESVSPEWLRARAHCDETTVARQPFDATTHHDDTMRDVTSLVTSGELLTRLAF